MSHSTEQHGQHGHDDFHPHIVPPRVLLTVFGILLVLTFLTVAVTKIDLGKLNIWIALAIAVVKAGVVGLYFMHLLYDKPFHGVILIVSLMFVALFIGIAMMDTDAYQPNLEGKPAATEAMP